VLVLFFFICSTLPAGGRGEEGERERAGESGAAEGRELAPGSVEAYQGPPIDATGEYVPTSIGGTPEIDMQSYRLRVDGLVSSPLSLSYEEVLALPRYTKTVEIICVEGWHARLRWTGVLIEELLESAGADPAARRIIFHAADGYSTSHSRSYLQQEEILLAFGVNGRPLSPELGFPFHLVAEARYGYKWAKWVTRIEVSADEEYRGYWESRGFSREGRVGERMYEGQ
jgi:DMSO/TMAO reductase YedYZ molybdopterin-dependent catalytic subunit